MASLVSTTVNGDLKVTGSSNLFFEGSASSNTFEPGTRIYGAGVTLTGGAYTSVFEYTVPGGLAGNFRFFVKGTTGNVVIPTQVDVLLNHYQDITIKSQSGNYTTLHVKVLTNDNEDCLVQIKADTHNNANVTVYIDVIAFGDGSVSFSSFGSYTGAYLEHNCIFGFAFSSMNGTTSTARFALEGNSNGRLGVGTDVVNTDVEVSKSSTTNGPVIRLANRNDSISAGGTHGAIEFFSGDNSNPADQVVSSIKSIHVATAPNYGELAFSTGSNSEAVRINLSGNVGIGTNAPAAKLQIETGNIRLSNDYYLEWGGTKARIGGSTTGDYVFFLTDNTDRMRIVSSGSVGIGTNSPDSKLEIAGGGYNSSLKIKGSGADTGIQFEDSAGNTDGYIYANGGMVGFLDAGTHWMIQCKDDDYIKFLTNNGTEHMRIKSDGNVGIGTDAPEGLLSFKADESNTPKIRFQNQHSVTTDAAISTYDDANGTTILIGSNLYIASDGSTARYNTGEESAGFRADRGGLLQFFTGETGATASERIRVLADGNVGIGTVSPPHKLSIYGTGAGKATVQIEGEGGADPYINFLVNNTTHWAVGADDSAGDSFKISQHSALGTNDRITVLSGGSVGIGTVSPAHLLDVNSGSLVPLRLVSSGYSGIEYHNTAGTWVAFIGTETGGGGNRYNSAASKHTFYNNSSAVVTINSDGNVGIGETAPDKPLHIKGTNTAGIVIENTTNATNMDIDWYNNVGSVAGRIRYSEGTGDFSFMPNQSTNAVVFRYDGNVGINTSSPSAKLHIESDGSHDEGAEIVLKHANNNTTDIVSTILFANNGGGVAMIQGGTTGANNTGYISFSTDNAGTSSEKVRIIGDGNVGIGDDTPENKLTVNGSSRFKDTMFFATTNRGLISWGTMGGGTGFGVQAASGNGLSLGANATWDHIVITTAGNVGIGRATAHGKLDILAADLGASSGDVSVVSRSSSDVGSNTMYLLEEYVRTSAGSDWTTAGVRLQAKTDSTYQGYIQFNGDSNNYGISFGAGAGGTSSPGTTAETMRIQSGGNVGIGTNSPSHRLHVLGATTGGWNGLNLNVVISSSNTYANGHAGGIAFGGAYNTSETQTVLAGVWASRPNAGNGQYGGIVHIGAREHGTNNIEKVINVTHASVGIGTTDPAADLEVSTASGGELVVDNYGSSGVVLQQRNGGATNSGSFKLSGGTLINFFTNDTEKVRIDSNGSVGIGTDAPTNRLHVEGSTFSNASIRLEKTTTGVNEDPGLVLAAANDTNGYRIGSIFFQGGTTSYAQIRAEMAGTGTGAKIYFIAGSQTNPVSNSATKTLEIEDGIITAATAIRPLTDSSYTLGQNTLRWSHLYVDAITCGGAISGTGASITSLNGSNISSGTVAAARLGSGSSITTKFLRGDNTWQTVSGGSGTVTSVATSGAITGGTITTSGTISHSTANGYKHIPADGADLKFLAYASAGTAEWAGGLLNYSDYALFAQRYDDGSSGGALSGGQWNTRVLNATVVNNYTTASAWASLGSNQITMQAGTYYARVWAVAYDIDEQQINLANVNNSNQLMLSAPMSARGNSTANSAVTMSEGTFAITTNGHKLVAYHWANLAETNTYGGGRPLEGGSTSPIAGIDYDYDTYVSVQIWRVA